LISVSEPDEGRPGFATDYEERPAKDVNLPLLLRSVAPTHACRVIVITFGYAWDSQLLSAAPSGTAGWSFQ
jgi:hypothetical protein